VRESGRAPDELRPVKTTLNYVPWAEGSVLFEIGHTKVLCNASIEEKTPSFIKGAGRGWLTAEYAMLPRATQARTAREAARGRLTGRTQEIQRLIGRSLRAVTDLSLLGERTVILDCDVIQADGGTRTASITGGYMALVLALKKLMDQGVLKQMPVRDWLAAVSVGKLRDGFCLDLDYSEDSKAYVDMNVVMTGAGQMVEIQGTAEQAPFFRQELDRLIDLAWIGVEQIIQVQKQMLGVAL
jgi:ribonuclease PH